MTTLVWVLLVWWVVLPTCIVLLCGLLVRRRYGPAPRTRRFRSRADRAYDRADARGVRP
jgi:hypothetical protein